MYGFETRCGAVNVECQNGAMTFRARFHARKTYAVLFPLLGVLSACGSSAGGDSAAASVPETFVSTTASAPQTTLGPTTTAASPAETVPPFAWSRETSIAADNCLLDLHLAYTDIEAGNTSGLASWLQDQGNCSQMHDNAAFDVDQGGGVDESTAVLDLALVNLAVANAVVGELGGSTPDYAALHDSIMALFKSWGKVAELPLLVQILVDSE